MSNQPVTNLDPDYKVADKEGNTQEIPLMGVFIAIGHRPNTDIFEGQLDMAGGYINITSGTEGGATATSVPGVFAAGDVQNPDFRQCVVAAGSGADLQHHVPGVVWHASGNRQHR